MAEESDLQTKILKDLESYRDMVAFKIMRCNIDGVPDIFFTNNVTGPCFLELKAPGKKPSQIQNYIIQKLNTNGIKAFWCDNWQGWVDIKNILNLSHDTLI